MMSKIISSSVILLLAPLSPLVIPVGVGAEQPRYESVPTSEERSSGELFVRFPGWQEIVIVQDGEVNETYAMQIDTSQWDKDIPIDSFKRLVLQDFDIKTASIAFIDETFTFIPFAVGIRYQASGHFLSEIVSQGTINAFGTIELVIKDKEIVEIKILKYHDSPNIEQYQRKLGLLDKYDSDFVVGVLRPLLKNYLTEKQRLQTLIDLVETHQEKTEGPKNYNYSRWPKQL